MGDYLARVPDTDIYFLVNDDFLVAYQADEFPPASAVTDESSNRQAEPADG